MTNAQKVIKYLAIAFAFSIIISIIYGVLTAFNLVGKISKNNNNNIDYYKKIELNEEDNEIDINLKITNLYIKRGNEYSIETNNKYIKHNEENKKLIIKEEANINLNKEYYLTLTIPNSINYENIKLDTGAGGVKIDSLNGNTADLDFGAGKVIIEDISIKNEFELDAGAGSLEIKKGTINNLDLDMGVGKVIINSTLTGNNMIDAGVGKLDINLQNKKENYTFKVSKGIGSIKLNNDEIKDNEIVGNGLNIVDINGGIGSINVLTTE